MKDKLETLERLFEETGSILRRDVDRCKSLYGEFVKQILDASELLSLDVVQGKLEIPKFGWLEESLQIRSEVEYAIEKCVPRSLLGEEQSITRKHTDSVKSELNEGPDITPQDDIGIEGDYNILMSNKCVQTTPLQRERASLGKKNLLKFLQKSNVLKNGDSIYFLEDKSYDADVSRAVSELTTANSSVTYDDCTLYPNSSYDISSSPGETLPSSLSGMSNDLHNETVSSSTDGSLYVGTPGFKRVRAKRKSMVSFLLPMKDDGRDAEEAYERKLSVCDQSKCSEVSAYQSISLIANDDSSLDYSSVPNASAVIQESIREPLELSQEISCQSKIIQNEICKVESGLNVLAAEQSDVVLLDTESIEEEQSENDSEKMSVVNGQNETHELATETSNYQDAEFSKEVVEQLDNDVIDCDQPDSTSVSQGVEALVSESISHGLHHGEMRSVQTMQQGEIISSDEADNEMNSYHDNEPTEDTTKTRAEAVDKEDDEPAKLKIKRRRRRRPPLVMPKKYRPPRRDFISLFNETRTRTSKSLLYQSSFFRKEPLSAGLRRFKETKFYKSILKENAPIKKEDRISKQRLPLFSSNYDEVSDDRGFDVIQRIVWTPQTANKQVDVNNESSLIVVDNAEGSIIRDQSTTPKSENSTTEKSQDEILLSIRAKPKRIQREDSYAVDLNLEIALQNGDRNCRGKRKASSRKGRGAVLRVKGAECRVNSLAEEKQDAKGVPVDTTVFDDFKSQFPSASESENKEESGDGSVVYNGALERPGKKRGRPAKHEGSSGDLKKKGTGRSAKAKRKVPSTKSITEITESVKDTDRDRLLFDNRDDVKNHAEESTLAKHGRRGLHSGVASRRVTRSSKNAARDSTKKTKQTRRLNPSSYAKKNTVENMQFNETELEEKSGDSRRHEELNESNKRTANGLKKCGGKISAKQRKVSRRKDDHSNTQNQKDVSDTNGINDVGKDGVQVNVNNESILSSKPSRIRKAPNFYGSDDSNLVDLSVSPKNIAARCESKSRKNPQTKSNSKMVTRSKDKSKLSADDVTDASATFVDREEVGPVEKRPRGKRKGAGSNINGDFKSHCTEQCDESEDHNGKDVNDAQIGGSTAKDEIPKHPRIATNAKATTKRRARVSAAPSLVIINESQEDTSVFQSPDDNEGENLMGAKMADEKDGHADLKIIKQSGDESLSKRGKRRERRKNDSKVAKKCVRKHPSDTVDIEDAACKNSSDLDNDMDVRDDLKDVIEESTQDIKEKDSDGVTSPIVEDGVLSIKETACKQDAEPLNCASNVPDSEGAGTLNDSVSGGAKDTHMGRRVGRRAKSGVKAAKARNDKRMGTRRTKVAKKVDEKIGADTTITRGHEKEGRTEDDIPNGLGQESNEDSGKSMEKDAKEEIVQLSSLETPDLRRSTRKKQNKSTAVVEKENEFIAPKAVAKNAVEGKPPVSKRSVGPGKENAVPEKKRRPLFNKKNTSLMSLNFSVMQETSSMNCTQNTTMNTNSIVMPQTLSNFLRSFVAPKVKKNAS